MQADFLLFTEIVSVINIVVPKPIEIYFVVALFFSFLLKTINAKAHIKYS